MKRSKRAAVIALAAVMGCSCAAFAGCDLVTKDLNKDYRQIIAEVDLTRSPDFEGDGVFASVKGVVENKPILKRDMISTYIANGANVQSQYGWSYLDTFNAIADSLVNRQVFVQYCKAYLAKNYGYTVDGYQNAIAGEFSSDAARRAAGLAYFLDEDEKAAADYTFRKTVNDAIDTLEEGFIKIEEDEHDHTADADVRTLPTGAETENDEYFDPDYRIYTGKETALGSYEKVEGSRPATRIKAYKKFLSNLRANDLLDKNENTSDFESMNYCALERESAYETAIINKVLDKFREEEEKKLTAEWAEGLFNETVAAQRAGYTKDKTSFESALDGMSNTSFVLAAPRSTVGGVEKYDAYGFVINILLPFSATQTQTLNEASNDYNDPQGGKFAARAALLRGVTATDQRGTWFTGHTDYSYTAGADAYTGGNADRTYLFFENSVTKSSGENARYEKLANYYGQYTYNGKVVKTETDGDTEYTITPNKITIDGFLSEMKGYLQAAGVQAEVTQEVPADYYTQTQYYFTEGEKKGEVDYSKFIYEAGKIAAFDPANGGTAFDANRMFVAGTNENKAFSVINELSFAYNTDTAGLNSYLGYDVSPYKTSYMAEFEYAAQWAVAQGAGTYAVVPTDYGWHIIYCTFSFADVAADQASPFTFDYDKRGEEDTFSYYYFEQLKATAVDTAATNRRTDAVNQYIEACSDVYSDRFSDLTGLDSSNS